MFDTVASTRNIKHKSFLYLNSLRPCVYGYNNMHDIYALILLTQLSVKLSYDYTNRRWALDFRDTANSSKSLKLVYDHQSVI